jgi:hypothetical protein
VHRDAGGGLDVAGVGEAAAWDLAVARAAACAGVVA